MKTVSNRGLTLLIVMTLALSVFTTILSQQKISSISDQINGLGSPTGFATYNNTGTASITLSSDVAIAITNAALDWGTGIANQTNGLCTEVILNTSGTTLAQQNPNNCWTNASDSGTARVETNDFHITNIGTTNVNLTINASKNSTDFFGFGSAATTDFAWSVVEGEGSGCTGLATGSNEFVNGGKVKLCDNLDYVNTNDELNISLYLRFDPSEATPGAKTATVYFRAENAS